ncbi:MULTISPECIES: 3'-5' exonuclease [Marinomonas]|uniref:3'-5' exonuclease n=1 Tax=Marinomonas rhodophyticola TaxID=2992803 RepID=A0ABT3KJZ7_9GAMM|nr:3'-5' exonuclease [Marinomonas sp. KJ51-3]MCW4630862.1 3'-5' exonuclease [Marinomonas sp. KJ51-3]
MLLRCLQKVKAWHISRQAMQRAWTEWNYLVLDIETSGLDPKNDHIVSFGWVCIYKGVIELDTARHIVLDSAPIGDSVGIHMITDSDVQQQGKRQESVLRYLRHLLRERVLVMHHAPMELGFLKHAWQTEALPAFSVSWLDTLAIERAKAHRSQQPIQDGGFRLGACRERYGLPEYQGHDALTDALATAELLLAQIAYQGKDCRLHDLNQMGGGRVKFTTR